MSPILLAFVHIHVIFMTTSLIVICAIAATGEFDYLLKNLMSRFERKKTKKSLIIRRRTSGSIYVAKRTIVQRNGNVSALQQTA